MREIQIKTTIRYHLTPIRMAILKSLQIINGGKKEKRMDYDNDSDYWHEDRGLCLSLNKLDSPTTHLQEEEPSA